MRGGWIMILLLMLGTLMTQAQELEYKAEVGGMIGLCSYLGDVNSNPMKSPSYMVGALVRRNFNQRMVIKGNLAMGRVGGNSSGRYIPVDAGSKTPEGGLPMETIHFGRSVLDLGAQFEFNFWGYGTGTGYKGNSPVTPYALLGLGATLVTGGGAKASGALNMPVGLGLKYKVRPRINVGLEWTFRFSTTDALDTKKGYTQLDNPYHTGNTMLKNKDCYSFLNLFMSYDICPKYRKCNN